MIKTIIIDDEHHGRRSLERALTQYCPEVQLIAICESPEAGLKAIQELKPDLVFLDIQMPLMSGFDVLQQLRVINFKVIFVTSYDHYAIKAIKFSALDYLLKPLDVDDLVHAVRRAREQIFKGNNPYDYQSVLNNINFKSGKIKKLAIPTAEGIDFFKIADIIYCGADGSYTVLHCINKQKQLISKNLKDFENLLSNSGFYRVHKSSLINLKHVKKYIRGEGGYVILTDDHHISISRRRKEAFLGALDQL